MGLFKVPKRNNISTQKILDLVENEEVSKPKITLRGTSLSAKIQAIGETVERNLGGEKDNYLLIQTKEEWLEYCKQAVEDGIVFVDTETTSKISMQAKLVGVCIYSESQKPAYVPVGHISTITEQLLSNQVSIEAITEGFNLFKKNKTKQVYHNSYYDKIVIYRNTGVWVDVYFDTLVCAHLLNENESHSLKDLYTKYCATEEEAHKFNELFDGIPLNYLPYTFVYPYGAKDSIMTARLFRFMEEYIVRGRNGCTKYQLEKVSDVFWNIEMPLTNVLAKMKIRGTLFDFDRADELREKYTRLKKEARDKFNKATECIKDEIVNRERQHGDISFPVNYNSPNQLKIIFYDILDSGVIVRKNPTGTGKEIIEEVMTNKKYDNTKLKYIVSHLTEVKKFDKMLSSFIDKLSDTARIYNGKIFCDYKQNGTDTQRLSSSNPKQNWAMMA